MELSKHDQSNLILEESMRELMDSAKVVWDGVTKEKERVEFANIGIHASALIKKLNTNESGQYLKDELKNLITDKVDQMHLDRGHEMISYDKLGKECDRQLKGREGV